MSHRADGLNDIFENDVTVLKSLNTRTGTVAGTPVNPKDITNKEYVDSQSGIPGGSDTQVQFNDGGAFGGDTYFTWDKTNNVLDLSGGGVATDSSTTIGIGINQQIRGGGGLTNKLELYDGGDGDFNITMANASWFVHIDSGNFACDGNAIIGGKTTPQSTLHINGGTGTLSTGLSFGDGDTGFFENSDDVIRLSFGGLSTMDMDISGISSTSASGVRINTANVPTSTFPVIIPNRSDANTGIGWAGADQLSLIAGGAEIAQFDTTEITFNYPTSQNYYHESYINSTDSLTIDTQNIWHGIYGATEGDTSDFTWHAGERGTITAIADAGGGDIRITANNTNAVGDPVTLTGGTGYDGTYLVTAATATTFDVTATFAATGTGFYIQPDNWECTAGGVYQIRGSLSGSSVSANQIFEWAAMINTTILDKGRPQRKFTSAGDIGNVGGISMSGTVSAGDRFSILIRNQTSAGNFTIEAYNIQTIRL